MRPAALMLSLLIAASPAVAQEGLKVGDPAPAFSLAGSDGRTHTLEEHKGKQVVVIAWFPKAFTGGCTAECKSLRANGESLKKYAVAVYAASIDPPEMNRDFAKSLELDYPILSDPDKTTAKAFGVLNPEGQYARRFTYYIGLDGKIQYVDQAVKPMTAGEDVAARLEALGVPKKAVK